MKKGMILALLLLAEGFLFPAFALAAGGIGWESTAGRPLRPIFIQIWQNLDELCRLVLLPMKKFFAYNSI